MVCDIFPFFFVREIVGDFFCQIIRILKIYEVHIGCKIFTELRLIVA